MPKINWSAANQTIDEYNNYFLHIAKNRRVLDLRERSTSFNTLKRIEMMHHPDFNLGEGTTLRMKILTRAYLLNLGSISEQIQQMHYEQYQQDLEIAKRNKVLLRDLYNALPESISFKLFGYEIEFFYIKAYHEGMIPVIAYRVLYNCDYNGFHLDQYEEEIVEELTKGINLFEFLQNRITFN